MAKLYNLARMTTATTGTGTITLGSAASGFLTFALAGVANGDVVAYGIKDGANSEVGTGTYTASGTTLTRSVTKSTNSNSPISLSGTAEVFIVARAEDILNPANNLSDVASAATARSNLGAQAALGYTPVNKAGDTMTGQLNLSSGGLGDVTKDDISTRTPTGFWETSTATTAEGWPESDNSWWHMLSSTRDPDTTNYWSMQFACSLFNTNKVYFRVTNNNGLAAWARVLTTANIADISGGGTTSFLRADGNWAKPNWSLLNTLTASSSANLSDTTSFALGYATYVVVFENVNPATASVQFQFQVSIGGTFQTSGYNGGALAYSGAGTGNAGNPGSCTNITDLNVQSGSIGVSGELWVNRPANTSGPKLCWGHSAFRSTIAQVYNGTLFHGGYAAANGAIDGIRFFFSSGNIASGTIRIYGVN